MDNQLSNYFGAAQPCGSALLTCPTRAAKTEALGPEPTATRGEPWWTQSLTASRVPPKEVGETLRKKLRNVKDMWQRGQGGGRAILL